MGGKGVKYRGSLAHGCGETKSGRAKWPHRHPMAWTSRTNHPDYHQLPLTPHIDFSPAPLTQYYPERRVWNEEKLGFSSAPGGQRK